MGAQVARFFAPVLRSFAQLSGQRWSWEAYAYYEGKGRKYETLQALAPFAQDGAEGCCETHAKRFGTFPTLFEGADGGVQILPVFRTRFLVKQRTKMPAKNLPNFDPSISPLEKRRESPETLRMLLAAPFRTIRHKMARI